MTSRVPAAVLLALAAALLAATRIPGDSYVQAAAAAASCALVALAPLLLGRRRAWVAPVALALLAGGLLLPTSRTAVLAGVPDLAVALVAALALLYVNRHDATTAPLLAERGRAGGRQALRFLPPVALAAVVAVLPWLLQRLLPARIADAYEMQTAAGPVVALLLLAVPIVILALLSRAVWGGAPAEPDEPDAHPSGETTP